MSVQDLVLSVPARAVPRTSFARLSLQVRGRRCRETRKDKRASRRSSSA